MALQATQFLQTILQQYAAARSGEAMTPHHPVVHAFSSLQRWMEAHGVVQAHPTMKVRWSAGVGRWAKVPWIALLDGRAATSTQRGVFCSLLFRSDMQGAYLALEQGARTGGRDNEAQEALLAQGDALRQELQDLGQAGFAMHGQIDLGDLELTHQHQVVAHKYYASGALPSEAEMVADVAALVHAYETHVAAQAQAPVAASTWLFQANPQAFNLRSALGSKAFTWPVKQHGESMRTGDRVYFWESGPQGGLVGTGVLQGAPEVMHIDPVARRASRKGLPAKDGLRVWVQPEVRLSRTLPRTQVLEHPDLSSMAVVRTPMAVNFEVTGAEQRALALLLEQAATDSQTPALRAAPPLAARPRLLSDALVASIRAARVHVSPGMETQVQALVACMLTRPCTMVLGPAGCGKTLLGQKLAEFWGSDRCLRERLPRGDAALAWLLGAPSGAASRGRQAWQMSPALQFLCRAQNDPRQLYLLLVDDVSPAALRGKLGDLAACIGAGEACLPAAKREADGQWRAPHARVAWPSNVTLLAMASTELPALAWQYARLDAWGLMPWLVSADDVPPRYVTPAAAPEAPPELLRAWLQLSQDVTWHDAYLDGDAGRLVASKILELGKLCDGMGMPLGHRFYMMARRFAALFAETAQATSLQSVDHILATAVVPRLLMQHPEVPAGALLRFTWDLSPNGLGDYDPWGAGNAPACLPRSHAALLGR